MFLEDPCICMAVGRLQRAVSWYIHVVGAETGQSDGVLDAPNWEETRVNELRAWKEVRAFSPGGLVVVFLR